MKFFSRSPVGLQWMLCSETDKVALMLFPIDEAATAGANMIVAGSSVFKGVPAEVIATLRR